MRRGYRRDESHGQLAPTGSDLGVVLVRLLRRQARAALSAASRGRQPDLTKFTEEVAAAFRRFLPRYARDGMAACVNRLGGKIQAPRGTKSARMSADDWREFLSIDWSPSVRRVIDAVNLNAFALARSTLATSTMEAGAAVRAARSEISAGIMRGEGIPSISNRVAQIFSPARALMIAQTEASRAFHAAELEAAIESGVVGGFEWLASDDACDLCRKLHGTIVPLGRPFTVLRDGTGPYDEVLHPPAHPHCMCAVTEVFHEDMPSSYDDYEWRTDE